MNRRRFIGMVAAVAAAAVGVVKRPKMPELSNLYGARKIERPISDYLYEPKSPVVFAQNDLNPNSVFSRIQRSAYNAAPRGMDYEIDPPRGVTVDRFPDDIVSSDVLYVHNGQIFRIAPSIHHDLG